MPKKIAGAQTKLERATQRIINSHAQDYDDGAVGFMADLQTGGCQSGLVGELVYYADTIKFYKAHQGEIDTLLKEMCEDTGYTPAQLFGKKWDADDFFARETNNQNLLAWFGFEETARRLAERNGIE